MQWLSLVREGGPERLQRTRNDRPIDERIDFFFEATAWSGAVTNAEPEKCDELAWYAFEDLPSNVVPYVRRASENYRAGILFEEFGWE